MGKSNTGEGDAAAGDASFSAPGQIESPPLEEMATFQRFDSAPATGEADEILNGCTVGSEKKSFGDDDTEDDDGEPEVDVDSDLSSLESAVSNLYQGPMAQPLRDLGGQLASGNLDFSTLESGFKQALADPSVREQLSTAGEQLRGLIPSDMAQSAGDLLKDMGPNFMSDLQAGISALMENPRIGPIIKALGEQLMSGNLDFSSLQAMASSLDQSDLQQLQSAFAPVLQALEDKGIDVNQMVQSAMSRFSSMSMKPRTRGPAFGTRV